MTIEGRYISNFSTFFIKKFMKSKLLKVLESIAIDLTRVEPSVFVFIGPIPNPTCR